MINKTSLIIGLLRLPYRFVIDIVLSFELRQTIKRGIYISLLPSHAFFFTSDVIHGELRPRIHRGFLNEASLSTTLETISSILTICYILIKLLIIYYILKLMISMTSGCIVINYLLK